VIPWEHKDTPEEVGSGWVITNIVEKILTNPANIKIFQNAKFDLKFLHTKGIQAVNVWDTKVMQHLVNENVPKSLNDLVNMYFPEELEGDTAC
jgi:ribonuclease D